jgi:hypothetical protein
MSDNELLTLAALANVESVLMAGDNAHRAQEGYSPAWRDGCGMMPFGTALAEEMERRLKGVNAAGTVQPPSAAIEWKNVKIPNPFEKGQQK